MILGVEKFIERELFKIKHAYDYDFWNIISNSEFKATSQDFEKYDSTIDKRINDNIIINFITIYNKYLGLKYNFQVQSQRAHISDKKVYMCYYFKNGLLYDDFDLSELNSSNFIDALTYILNNMNTIIINYIECKQKIGKVIIDTRNPYINHTLKIIDCKIMKKAHNIMVKIKNIIGSNIIENYIKELEDNNTLTFEEFKNKFNL